MRIQEFNFSVNVLEALLWQYNDAEKLQSLLQSKQDWYNENQRDFWANWYHDVFDLRTANDFGLSVWSIILNIPLFVEVPFIEQTNDAWGFGSFRKNFNNGNFGAAGSSVNVLTKEQKRLILRLRYFQLCSRGAIPEINEFLFSVRDILGECYVLDGLNMTITYVFAIAPSANILYVLENFDILPRPAGVKLNLVVSVRDAWGFGEYRKNFNHGNFVNGH